jgi:hypothetical protein
MSNINDSQTFHWLVYQHKHLLDGANMRHTDRSKILEIGSGRFSSVGLYFDCPGREITLGCYDEKDLMATQMRMDFLSEDTLASYKICKIDIFELREKYDLIIMKSVLGGLFRNDQEAKNRINTLIDKLLKENLNENGCLVTIDNGASVIDSLFSKIGSRAQGWHYIHPNDFKNYFYQNAFGILSIGSFVNRSASFGRLLDFFIFKIDQLLAFFGIHGSAQVITVFVHNDS